MSQVPSTEMLLSAYRSGVFPMAEPDGEIYWYSPDPRCVFEFDRFHVPRTLRQIIRQGRFEIRINTRFAEVIAASADRHEGTWISPDIMEVYCRLHEAGFAHSVESWRGGRLVGGLYGVALGGAFFGESMFHRDRDASKVTLVALMERLKSRGYVLVDTQWITPHLARFGAVEISREAYARRLEQALALNCCFVD